MDTQQHTRSRQLAPLSREHEDGMLFITRIREGLGKYSIERLSHYTRWYWKNHIRPHFFHEEKGDNRGSVFASGLGISKLSLR